MNLRSLYFKCYVVAPFDSIPSLWEQIGLRPTKKHHWSRSIQGHTFEVEYREKMSSREQQYFVIQWITAAGSVDIGALDRVLAEWFFAASRHFTTFVFRMYAEINLPEFTPLYGYTESTPKIWTKEEKPHKFSFYPYQNHYIFEVRCPDARKPIQHHLFARWIEDLKHNLLGHQRPNDQIRFDLQVG